jgi:hypothetical protein
MFSVISHTRHHEIQELGRGEVLLDYHLRVGQLTQDTEIPEGYELREQRLEETEVGEGTALTLINMKRPDEWTETTNPADCAGWLGLNPWGEGLINYWDLFEAVLTADDLILLVSWRDQESAREYAESFSLRMVRGFAVFAWFVIMECSIVAKPHNTIPPPKEAKPRRTSDYCSRQFVVKCRLGTIDVGEV